MKEKNIYHNKAGRRKARTHKRAFGFVPAIALAAFFFGAAASSAWSQPASGINTGESPTLHTSGEYPSFFTALTDIPLMPGLIDMPDDTLYFDKPEGRIIEATAALGDLRAEDVILYYQATLPQFGWGRVGKTSFFRENEYLDISFESRGDSDLVKIMIRPAL